MRVCLTGLLALLIGGAAQAQDPVALVLPDTVVYPDPGAVSGTAFSFPITIDEDVTGRGIQGVDIVLSYDPAVISLTDFQLGELVPAGCTSFGGTDTGEINVRIACGSSTPLAGGPGRLVTLSGTLIAEGSTGLELTDDTPFNEGNVAAAITDGRARIVTDPNPSLTPFEDRTLEEDGSTVYTFTLSDNDNDPETLTVTASSSSTDLVDSAGLAIAACGGLTLMDACRTLTVSPAANASGTATITVTVDDNSARSDNAVETFVLTVTPVNDAPTVVAPIDDREIPAANDPWRIELASFFADVDGEALEYAASSSAPAVATVSIEDGDAVITPQSVGTTTVTLSATDGANETAQDAFVLTVTSAVSTAGGDGLAFEFRGATPNPTAAFTRVRFDLPTTSEVTVSVYDVVGRQIEAVPAQVVTAGPNRQIELSLLGQPAGVYIVRLEAQTEGTAHVRTGQVIVAR